MVEAKDYFAKHFKIGDTVFDNNGHWYICASIDEDGAHFRMMFTKNDGLQKIYKYSSTDSDGLFWCPAPEEENWDSDDLDMFLSGYDNVAR